MLQLTLEETAFNTEFAAAAEALNAEIRNFTNLPRLSYQATAEERAERAAEEQRLVARREAHNARQKERVAVRVGLKTEFNTFIAKTVPGGEAGALIEVAQEILATFISDENTIAAAGLLKTVVVTGIDAFNDADIHAARARGVFARYTALVATGLPEDFVRQIMIAEAARAIPMPSMPSNSKR